MSFPTSTFLTTHAESKGRQAAKEGILMRDNPYTADTDEAKAWTDGWKDQSQGRRRRRVPEVRREDCSE